SSIRLVGEVVRPVNLVKVSISSGSNGSPMLAISEILHAAQDGPDMAAPRKPCGGWKIVEPQTRRTQVRDKRGRQFGRQLYRVLRFSRRKPSSTLLTEIRGCV